MNREEADWVAEFPASIVVTDAAGAVLSMNRRAVETFSAEGGRSSSERTFATATRPRPAGRWKGCSRHAC